MFAERQDDRVDPFVLVDEQSVSGVGIAGRYTKDHTESITVDLGQSQSLSQVSLFPRSDDPNIAGLGFPIDFTIQLSEDNTNWVTPITRTAYARPSPTAQAFALGGRTARYVKVTGTKLSQPAGQYWMQFAEIEVS